MLFLHLLIWPCDYYFSSCLCVVCHINWFADIVFWLKHLSYLHLIWWLIVHIYYFNYVTLFLQFLLLFLQDPLTFLFKKKIFIYLFLERGREREREGEKHQCVVASHAPATGDLACNPGICPRLGIELETLWFTGQHSIHRATQARAL